MKLKNAYRSITAALLAVIFFTANFGELFTVAGYYINTSAYALNCVNKSKPQMHCNGKCQLQKKLDTQNNDKQSTEKKSDTGSEVLSSKTFFATLERLAARNCSPQYFPVNNTITVDKSFSFFHPPQGQAA